MGRQEPHEAQQEVQSSAPGEQQPQVPGCAGGNPEKQFGRKFPMIELLSVVYIV